MKSKRKSAPFAQQTEEVAEPPWVDTRETIEWCWKKTSSVLYGHLRRKYPTLHGQAIKDAVMAALAKSLSGKKIADFANYKAFFKYAKLAGKSACIDYFRRAGAAQRGLEYLQHVVASLSGSPRANAKFELFVQEFMKLDEDERRLLESYYGFEVSGVELVISEDMNLEQIAATIGKSPSAASRQIRGVVNRLRQVIYKENS